MNRSPGAQPPAPAPPPSDQTAARLRLHRSRLIRWLFWALGTLAVIMGIIGIFLPVLPTTPFILLAAACYARASERFYGYLLRSRSLGPLIHEWEEHRSLPWRTKKIALLLMLLSISFSLWMMASRPWVQAFLLCVGVSAAISILRIPSRDE